MGNVRQLIFTRSYSEELRERLSSGSSLTEYLEEDMAMPEAGTLQATLDVSDAIPELDPSVNADTENAIKVYEFLDNLDKTQASDKRLWIYLSHVTFRKYTIGRWEIKASAEDLTYNSEAKRKAISYIAEHWFLSGNARSLRRHSIARLWWAAYLTVAPWERDSEYFGELEDEDRYKYTRVVFSTQDIAQNLLERRLGWSDRILIAVLEYLRQNPEVAQNREHMRNLVKELNLILGYRKLATLSFSELLAVVTETSESI